MTDEGTRTVVAALHRLSGEVDAPPTVLTDAYRHAGRLRRRHRAVLAGVLVLALAAAGAGAQWYTASRHGPVRTAAYTAADLLTRPTRGDLAGDAGYRQQVIAVWRASKGHQPGAPDGRSHKGSATYTPTGAPSVVLAQHTPAGPVAIVVQRTTMKDPVPTKPGQVLPSNLPTRYVTVGYLAAGTDGTPAVVATDLDELTEPLRGLAFLTGADRSYLVVLSVGDALVFSAGRTYPPAGPPTRDFSPIPLTGGVAVVDVPAGADRTALAVAAPPADGFADKVEIASPWPLAGQTQNPETDRRLQWYGPLWVLPDDRAAMAAWGISDPRQNVRGMTAAATPVIEAWRRAFDAEEVDPFADAGGESLWFAYGALPDGRAFVVGDGQIGNDPSYLYGAVVDHGRQTTLYGGKVDPTAVLPVRLRFPDGQGWLVAAKGAAFRYRTGTGGWRAAGTNAALLPAGASQVEVTPAGGQPVVAPLS